MNVKGADWIGRPEIERISLHTIEFISETKHSVFFTLGEEGSLSLSLQSEAEAAFALCHTPSDYIIFRKDRTITSFRGIRTETASGPGQTLKAAKEGKEISFTGDDGFSFRVSSDAFTGSASIGVVTEGKGKVRLEVF